jgi:hypothetical protein
MQAMPLSPRLPRRRLGGAILLLTLSACSHVAVQRYHGTVLRVESSGMSGYVASPRSSSGYSNPARIQVRLDADAPGPASRLVWIRFTEPNAPVGQAGDAVSFVGPRQLAADGVLEADDLREIQVTPKTRRL